jgi:non-lysosomal glucosylceramidase
MIPRRNFLKLSSAAMMGMAFSRMPVMAGPFAAADWNSYVPADKMLRPEWVKSLFARGEPTEYAKSRGELRFIGMPVGGICCGTMYLSGDGRLWCWDIFNQNREGILNPEVTWGETGLWFGDANNSGKKIGARNGANYVRPRTPDESPAIAQGFALRLKYTGKTETRKLDAGSWAEVIFTGQYPVGTVNYTDPAAPVAVKLEAFSPFIPLNADDSGLPATIFQFTLTNTSGQNVETDIAGWLQNATAFYSARPDSGSRVNSVRSGKNSTLVAMRFQTAPGTEIEKAGDFGTLALAFCGTTSTVSAAAANEDGAVFTTGEVEATARPEEKLTGSIATALSLAPGETKVVSFVIAWHFPKNALKLEDARSGNYYAKQFSDATAVAEYIAADFSRLAGTTRLWRDTWADSTLPHWFLERTFANTSTLATTTCHRFGTGRFWAWEGVGCCPGTCTHVWHYAQAMARIFPELERDVRERVDLGIGFNAQDGEIGFRAEFDRRAAVDGQAGRILGVWREHQMSADDAFLRRVWPRVKQATTYLLKHDTDGDGILDGPQENTLDAAWYGEIPWISSLAIAAWQAAGEMARVMGDEPFAEACDARFARGKASIEGKLWNGEYFIQVPEAGHEKNLGTYQGCHIDQVFGQSWAWQVALGRVLDREKTLSALRALWKYNFTPDVGPFRRKMREGRPYALAGDAGLIMTTNPRLLPDPFGGAAWQGGYFNECMSGFEHQAASHMMAEGMLLEGLAVTRAIHDRYHAAHRNPWNEIECSDHYARAMASYGSFISAGGFEFNGPKAGIGFAPVISPENFKCPFTAARGWGTFSQQIADGKLAAEILVRQGELVLKTVALKISGTPPGNVTVSLGRDVLPARLELNGSRAIITLNAPVKTQPGQPLNISLS